MQLFSVVVMQIVEVLRYEFFAFTKNIFTKTLFNVGHYNE